MKKTVAILCITTIFAGVLTGCVSKKSDVNDQEEAKAVASSQEETIDNVTNDKKNVVQVYTALEDEQIGEYLEDFKEDYPDVEVQITRDSTGVITAKLLAEKENPIADVVWGLSATSLLVLKQNDMLEGYAPKGVERILPEFKDAAEVPTWVGIDAWETAFLVNKEVLKSKGIDEVPTSYQDLLDPKYKGLIAMSNPASSGTGLLTVNGVLQLMGEEEGWKYLDALDENVAVYMHSGSQPAKSTATGEYGIGVSFGYRCLKSQSELGEDIAVAVFPSEGSGWDMEANALIKKDTVNESAKTFLDWAISDDAMKMYGTNYPIVAIGTGGNIPEGYASNPVDQLIKGMDFDKAAANREEILTQWTNRYDGKSASKES